MKNGRPDRRVRADETSAPSGGQRTGGRAALVRCPWSRVRVHADEDCATARCSGGAWPPCRRSAAEPGPTPSSTLPGTTTPLVTGAPVRVDSRRRAVPRCSVVFGPVPMGLRAPRRVVVHVVALKVTVGPYRGIRTCPSTAPVYRDCTTTQIVQVSSSGGGQKGPGPWRGRVAGSTGRRASRWSEKTEERGEIGPSYPDVPPVK